MARRPRPAQLDLFAAAVPAMEPRGSIAGSVSSSAQTGFRWRDGTACCLACFPTFLRAGLAAGHGYYMSFYRSRAEVLVRCAACGVPFPGATAEAELRRSITSSDAPPPSAPHA
jgi:hypothetical protein